MTGKTVQGTNRHIMRSPIFRSKTLHFDPELLALCSLPIFPELKIGRQSPIERSLYNFSAQSLQKKKLEGDWFRNRDFGYGGSASAYMKQIPSYIGSTFLDGLYTFNIFDRMESTQVESSRMNGLNSITNRGNPNSPPQ